MPGRTVSCLCNSDGEFLLQWRAGQLPGRTLGSRPLGASGGTRFNGGPGNCPAEHAGDGRCDAAWERASMEGRAIARPNPADGPHQRRVPTASMEGRAIARPNMAVRLHDDSVVTLQWRAGQLPGRTRDVPDMDRGALHASMEGRAIARPNRHVLELMGGLTVASMEGRAIARPNLAAAAELAGWVTPLQWRAGQLPGRTPASARIRSPLSRLQWRAGQLPGRTPVRVRYLVALWRCFNGGPGNCPAERGRHRGDPAIRPDASMEGRAIARPNPLDASQCCTSLLMLQWRAGQLPGRTTC